MEERKKLVDFFLADDHSVKVKYWEDEMVFKVHEDAWKKYRKKPVVVEAIEMPYEFSVETMEGTMEGKKGDYLIRGVKGELYPCDAEIFHETYVEVEQMPPMPTCDACGAKSYEFVLRNERKICMACFTKEIMEEGIEST